MSDWIYVVPAALLAAAVWALASGTRQQARKPQRPASTLPSLEVTERPAPPLPRRVRLAYVPAEPLTSEEADTFGVLVYAYRNVTIPEPSERGGQ